MAAESDARAKYSRLPPVARLEDTGTSQETRLALEPTPIPDPNDEDFILLQPRD